MNCETAESLFSDLFDGQLQPAELAEFEAHIASCSACAANYAAFERATSALRQTAAAGPDANLAASMLAAVDRAVDSENQRSDDDFRRAMTLVRGDAARADRRRRVAGRIGTLLAGAAAAVVFLQLSRGTLSSQTVEVIREQRVEVPVEVVKEVRVPVEVEVIREVKVPVEVVKEVRVPVEVEVVREVEVPRGPWIAVDSQRVAAAVDQLGQRILTASKTVATSLTENATLLADTSGRRVTPPIRRTLFDDYRGDATLEIREEDGRVKVRGNGPLGDFVPLLLTALEAPERLVADAAVARLTSIHGRLAGDPATAPKLTGTPPERSSTSAARWRAWWSRNSAQLGGNRV